MTEILNGFAEEKGILLGVCDASRMDWLTPILQASETPFVCRDIERRIDPRRVMPSAKSIIVVGVGHPAAPPPPRDGMPRGRLAAIALGRDYHASVKELLAGLGERLLEVKSFEYKIFVDAGHLNERALAVKAGLGFVGRNGSVISEKFGSFFNIGYMLTDLNSESYGSAESFGNKMAGKAGGKICDGCNQCVSACPTAALGDTFDARKCVSYLNQKKSGLTADEARAMKNWIYGCDTCQDVCPLNANVERRADRGAHPLLSECAGIDDGEFERRYGQTALFWRGADIFRRNTAIAAENCAI